ncbi:T9SS sorting signal type C domain-containing protein [Flavobacterium sp.]|uniref:T9SS sorting signal type C domain-containing protein n=1 Tax=Flavobacterium sp. TaxID=239 RepID=UPI0025EFFDB1|nr:T9SS sorting signal type C domain-containing protein [Flavobacterium sp.]
MKRVLFIFWIAFSINFSYSQLFVKNNSFIFNKGTVVYSKGNLELNGINSNFYLRNEGQFVQGTVGVSSNTGVGKLSVFQEGTVNNYAYNYWCSPIGNATLGVTTNENFGITMLNLPSTNTISAPATINSSSYNGFSGTGTLFIASYWIFRFLAQSNYSGWVQSAATTTIAPGQGFTMKGTSGSDLTTVGEVAANNTGSAQRYDFRGKPNDGTITVGVATNNFTLTGNPYPSALHVNAFLLDPTNTDCTGIAYYWEQDKTINSHNLTAYRGGYGTYAPGGTLPTDYGVYVPAFYSSYYIDGTVNTTGSSSGLSIQRKYAPIGQGFMIKGKSSGSPTSVTLKNTHRAYYKESGAYSHFERISNVTNYNQNNGVNTTSLIRLNTIINNINTRQIALTFMPNATDGVDRGIDALSPDPDLTNDVYFLLANEKYVIEGVNFDIEKRIPIGVNVSNATSFKFSIADVVNFDENQEIYIYDGSDSSYHNLKQNDYEVVLQTGIYNNRFEITFKNENLSVDHSVKNNVIIFQDNANHQLTLSNPNFLDIRSVSFFDILGKEVFEKVNLGSKTSYEFSTASLSDGVYLIKVQSTDGQIIGKKIIVSSK